MSKGFTFEKNLPHQKAGVDAVMNSMVLSIQKIITMLKATSLTFLWRQGRVKPIPTQKPFLN